VGGGSTTLASHLLTIEQALVKVLELLEAQKRQIEVLQARPLPTYRGSILGVSVSLSPE